ncbi:MAG: hypothetical protein KAT90_06510 [Gammaproteobacteria bacterium]|nr:hypothetical protein [Gammaproteobacteria bacterium]
MAKQMIKNVLKDGLNISVGSEGEIDLHHSTKYSDIKADIEAVSMADIIVYKDKERLGWIIVSFHDSVLADWESVSDYSVKLEKYYPEQ